MMQNNLFYLLLLPFGMALVTWPLAKSVALKFDIMDHPNHRKIHAMPTICTGGLMILLAYFAGLFLSGAYFYPECQILAISAFFLFTLGLIEDKHCLGAKLRILFQTGIVCFFVISSGAVLKDLGLFSIPWFLQIPFTVFAIVGIVNAFNLIDGMNGLSSGLAMIATSTLGFFSLFLGDIEVFTLAILFTGALAGFMFFNFRGKIFMGDSGSYLTGFMVAALSVILVVRNPDLSPFALFLIVQIPVFDTLFAIYRRLKLKKNPLKADKKHLHHMLARRYKSNIRSVMVILLLQAAISLLAVLFYGHTYVLMGLVIISGLFLRRLWFKGIIIGNIKLI